MMEGMEKHRDPARIRFWVFIGLLAATGVTLAFIATFGFNDSIAFDIVWRVFVVLLYIVISFAAQHLWLRLTTWTVIGITFVLGLANVFPRYLPFIPQWQSSGEYRWGDLSTGWNPWFGIEQDLEVAAHMICVGLLGLGLLSLAYRWIMDQPVLQGIYWGTIVFTLISLLIGAVLIMDSRHRWNIFHQIERLEAGIVILAMTGAVIIVIGAFVQRRSIRADSSRENIPVVDTGSAQEKLRAAGIDHDDIRALVRRYVDEYLDEKRS